MKKLFLTSGIIVCMACPAFATDPVIAFPASGHNTGYTLDTETPANGYVNQDSTDQILDGSGECVDDYLLTTSGPVQLQAVWEQNWETINLNKNTSNGGDTDSSAVIDPAQLWAVINTAPANATPNGGVYNSYDGTIGQTNFTPTTPVAANGTIAMSAPDGITTTYTFDLNSTATHGRTPTGEASASTPTRLLTKFTAGTTDATGDTDDYITVSRSGNTKTYTLTSAGQSAAQNATVGTPLTWYAQYDCATPTITNTLALDGYQFAGWTYSSGSDVDLNYHCETLGTQELTAQWTPLNYTIAFDCGVAGTSSVSMTAGNATQTQNTVTATQTIAMDGTQTITTSCAASGYVFQGWSCTTTNGGALSASAHNASGADTLLSTINASNGTVSQAVYLVNHGNVSCSAIWGKNQIDLHWDANNATTVTSAGGDSCTYDGSITVPSAARTGYILTGWTVTATEGQVTEQNAVDTANVTYP